MTIVQNIVKINWTAYYGWDAEIPLSFFDQFPYINAGVIITGNVAASGRQNNASTIELLKQYFALNNPQFPSLSHSQTLPITSKNISQSVVSDGILTSFIIELLCTCFVIVLSIIFIV